MSSNKNTTYASNIHENMSTKSYNVWFLTDLEYAVPIQAEATLTNI